MARRIAIALLALTATFAALCAFAADHPTESKRKLVNRVMPFYPQMARTMGLSGVVKIEAIVGNDGNPKLVDVKGGHPVLVQAAVDAVRRWKWEPASHETKEPIEVTFAPESQ
jgi:TonB family protein